MNTEHRSENDVQKQPSADVAHSGEHSNDQGNAATTAPPDVQNQDLQNEGEVEGYLDQGEQVHDVSPPAGGQLKEGIQTPSSNADDDSSWYEPILGLAFLAVVGSVIYYAFSGSGQFTVTAGLLETEAGVTVVGRVESDSKPVKGAKVWADALDQHGNPAALPSEPKLTDDTGSFAIAIGAKADIVRLHAMRERSLGSNQLAEQILRAGPSTESETATDIRAVIAVVSVLGSAILGMLLGSILLSLVVPPKGKEHSLRKRYYAVVVLVFFFPVFMAAVFGVAQSRLVSAADENQALPLRIATIFKGTFVEGADADWLITLTTPSLPAPRELGVGHLLSGSTAQRHGENASEEGAERHDVTPPNDSASTPADNVQPTLATETPVVSESPPVASSPRQLKVTKGFGAPLWVLFLSVIGAGFVTILLLIREIHNPPDASDNVGIRKRMQVLVEHEFYILFAPIGGVFLYQLMVLTNTAQEPVTVALAALGAGATVNAVLSKGAETAARTLTTQHQGSLQVTAAERSSNAPSPPRE